MADELIQLDVTNDQDIASLKQAEKELSNSHAEKLHRFDGDVIDW